MTAVLVNTDAIQLCILINSKFWQSSWKEETNSLLKMSSILCFTPYLENPPDMAEAFNYIFWFNCISKTPSSNNILFSACKLLSTFAFHPPQSIPLWLLRKSLTDDFGSPAASSPQISRSTCFRLLSGLSDFSTNYRFYPSSGPLVQPCEFIRRNIGWSQITSY